MVTEACKMALRSGARSVAVFQMRVRLAQARDRRPPRSMLRPISPRPMAQPTVMQRWLDLNA